MRLHREEATKPSVRTAGDEKRNEGVMYPFGYRPPLNLFLSGGEQATQEILVRVRCRCFDMAEMRPHGRCVRWCAGTYLGGEGKGLKDLEHDDTKAISLIPSKYSRASWFSRG